MKRILDVRLCAVQGELPDVEEEKEEEERRDLGSPQVKLLERPQIQREEEPHIRACLFLLRLLSFLDFRFCPCH